MASLMIQLLEQRLELLYDLSRREREVTRRSGDLLQQRQQNVALSLPVPARAHGQHAHALPAHELDDLFLLEQRVRLGDRHRIHFQLLRDLPDGRQEVAGAQTTPGDLRPNLVHELPINRHAGGGGDVHRERGPHVYWYSNTPRLRKGKGKVREKARKRSYENPEFFGAFFGRNARGRWRLLLRSRRARL